MFLEEIFDLRINNDNRENLKTGIFCSQAEFSEACYRTFAAELRLILQPLVIGKVNTHYVSDSTYAD